MKIISTLLFLLLSLFASAQPSLLSNEMAAPGTTYFYKHMASFTAIDTSLTGANQNWNFTTLSPTADPDYTVTIVDPAQTPYYSTFPTSNWAFLEGPDPYYNYYHRTSTQMERIGSYDVIGVTAETYSDPQVEYLFPFQLGTTNLDNWVSTGSSFPGTYFLECKATGTLTVPGHVYTNVLFVHVIVDNVFTVEAYFWYDSNSGVPLCEYIPGDGGFIPEAGVYLYNQASGIKTPDLISELHYNNPVTDRFHLTFNLNKATGFQYSLVNSTGQVIRNGILSKSSEHFLQLDFIDLSKGVYFLTLVSDNEMILTRTIRIIRE